jgi:hypothetical protein
MSKTNDDLERENAQLRKELAERDYKFDPAGKLRRGIESDHAKLEQRRRERRNQDGGDNE